MESAEFEDNLSVFVKKIDAAAYLYSHCIECAIDVLKNRFEGIKLTFESEKRMVQDIAERLFALSVTADDLSKFAAEDVSIVDISLGLLDSEPQDGKTATLNGEIKGY